MEIHVKGFGGFVAVGLVALSGYVLYLKGKSDAAHEIRSEVLEVCKTFNYDAKTEKT